MPAEPAPAASDLARALLERATIAAARLGRPRVRRALLVDPAPSPDRDAEFGLLTLDDGAVGLYYAWLGGTQAALPTRVDGAELEGSDALDVAQRYLRPNDVDRSLGIAAVNALTRSLHARAGYRAPDAEDSFGGLAPLAGDRLGLVGNFPPLVRRARAGGVEVRVLERKARMVERTPGLEISLDPAVLAGCRQVLCTGATLLTDSLDDVLGYCRDAERIVLVGPTVGCFPDDLFARGIEAVAGTEIVDGEAAWTALAAGRRLGSLARRTLIRRADYPGFDALLERVTG